MILKFGYGAFRDAVLRLKPFLAGSSATREALRYYHLRPKAQGDPNECYMEAGDNYILARSLLVAGWPLPKDLGLLIPPEHALLVAKAECLRSLGGPDVIIRSRPLERISLHCGPLVLIWPIVTAAYPATDDVPILKRIREQPAMGRFNLLLLAAAFGKRPPWGQSGRPLEEVDLRFLPPPETSLSFTGLDGFEITVLGLRPAQEE